MDSRLRVLAAWVGVTLVAAWGAFEVGTLAYYRRYCGPEATDCDLGILWGAPAAAGVLVVSLVLGLVARTGERRSRAVRTLLIAFLLVGAAAWGVWTASTHWSGEDRALGAGAALVAVALTLLWIARRLAARSTGTDEGSA